MFCVCFLFRRITVPERARGRQQLWQSPEEAAADALVWTHDKFDELMQLEEEHPLKVWKGEHD